jgi:ADP-ribose pyrophosphatase
VEDRPDKPNGARLGWTLRGRHTPFNNDVFAIVDDEIEVNGKPRRYAYMERAAAVIIVPVTREGEIVTVKQYRYPVDAWCLEVPAGGTHDVETDSLEKVARKELRGEIGATAGVLTYVDFFYSADALTDEKCHVFVAEDVDLAKTPDTETTEEIEIKLMSASEAVDAARRGKMKTAQSALAVLMCEPLLRERGYIV